MNAEVEIPFQSEECSRKGQWRHIRGWSELKGISIPGGLAYQSGHTNITKNRHKQQIHSLQRDPTFYWHNHRLTGGSCNSAAGPPDTQPCAAPWWTVQMRLWWSGPSPVTSFIRVLSDSCTERWELLHVLNHIAGFSLKVKDWGCSMMWCTQSLWWGGGGCLVSSLRIRIHEGKANILFDCSGFIPWHLVCGQYAVTIVYVYSY